MFTCTHLSYPDAFVLRCMVEKLIIIISMVAVGFLVNMMYFIYFKHHGIGFRDIRMWVFAISLLLELLIINHYGILYADKRPDFFWVLEDLRLLVHFSIAYYYVENASGLLRYRK